MIFRGSSSAKRLVSSQAIKQLIRRHGTARQFCRFPSADGLNAANGPQGTPGVGCVALRAGQKPTAPTTLVYRHQTVPSTRNRFGKGSGARATIFNPSRADCNAISDCGLFRIHIFPKYCQNAHVDHDTWQALRGSMLKKKRYGKRKGARTHFRPVLRVNLFAPCGRHAGVVKKHAELLKDVKSHICKYGGRRRSANGPQVLNSSVRRGLTGTAAYQERPARNSSGVSGIPFGFTQTCNPRVSMLYDSKLSSDQSSRPPPIGVGCPGDCRGWRRPRDHEKEEVNPWKLGDFRRLKSRRDRRSFIRTDDQPRTGGDVLPRYNRGPPTA